jgi:hypothetical protein
MEEMKVISVAHSRYHPEQRSLPKELGRNMGGLGNSPQIRPVNAHGKQYRRGEEESRYYGSWIRIMRPIGGIETGAPLDILVLLGRGVIGG